MIKEIEDYAFDEETTKYDDHNNNKKKKLRDDTLNDSSIDHFGFYQTNSKTNNSNSCFQLQDMSKGISDYHSSSTQRHIPKVSLKLLFSIKISSNVHLTVTIITI